MSARQTLADALHLEPVRDILRAYVPGEWVYEGRAFGGYVAALAARTAVQCVPGLTLRSLQIVLPRATEPGAIECTGRPLRAGRSTTIVQIELRQHGEPVALGEAWLVSPELTGLFERGTHGYRVTADLPKPDPAPDPEDCPRISWLAEDAPFLRHFEERAIDYPLALAELQDGPASCDLWARPDTSSALLGDLPAAGRLIDLLLLDAHLLDAVYRHEGIFSVLAVTLDLWVSWLGPGDAESWRRVQSQAAISGPLVITTGTLRAADGSLRAVAASQGRVFQRRPD